MNRIAFIFGESFLYWSSIVLTLAAASAVLMFLALQLRKGDRAAGAVAAVPVAMVLSVVLARLVHWYCQSNSYESFRAAMSNFGSGGYALMGVFAACLITALLLRLIRVIRDLPSTLDCMCIAGSLGICAGRLASLFNASDRGRIVEGWAFPWAYPVINAVSGEEELRVATFMIQSMAAGVLFAGLLIWYTIVRDRKNYRKGDVCLVFLLCYGASQIVLDSTRYDSLYLRSNGFVSMVQILGAFAIVIPTVIFCVRMVKARGWHWGYLGFFAGLLALVGGAGYMEYHVQRHGNQAAFAYSVMSICLGCYLLLSLTIRLLGRKKTPQTVKQEPAMEVLDTLEMPELDEDLQRSIDRILMDFSDEEN